MGDHRGDLLAALAAIGRSLQDVFDPRRFLTEFAAHIERLLPHDRLMIAYREEGGALSVFAEHTRTGPLLHEGRYTIDFDPGGYYSPDEWVVEPVLRGELTVVRDSREDPRFRREGAEPPKIVRLGLRSRVAVPLASGGRIVGILFVGSATPNTYTQAHAAMACQVAELISPFIENIVLLHREQRRRRRLANLVGLTCVFGSSLDFTESFEQVADAVRPILDFDAMGVGLLGVRSWLARSRTRRSPPVWPEFRWTLSPSRQSSKPGRRC
jgi:GAF domain-containing protein